MKLETKIENWILGHYLSDYDESKDFDSIIDDLANDSESIVIWEPFEDWNTGYLADYLVELRSSLIREFKE